MKDPKAHVPRREIFTYRDLSLEYIRVGSGARVIIAFHGFGRKPEDFLVFRPLLHGEQSLISIHLFMHGQSCFPKERIPSHPLGTQEFAECIAAFISSLGIDKVDLLGYSLGGKIALCLIEQIPERIREVLLFAPDGLKINPLYKWTSNTRSGRALYRLILAKPKMFFSAVALAKQFGVIPEKIHRFVMYHMNTYEKRKLVYDVWLVYRNFEPNPLKIRRMCENHSIRINLVFGKFDRIIPPANSKRLLKGWRPECLHVLEKGHLLLSADIAAQIKPLWFGCQG